MWLHYRLYDTFLRIFMMPLLFQFCWELGCTAEEPECNVNIKSKAPTRIDGHVSAWNLRLQVNTNQDGSISIKDIMDPDTRT